jgi:hypothetical protein
MLQRALCALAFAAAAAHAFAGEERFTLPAGAAMALTVPAGWKHQQQAADPRSISLTPASGQGFRIELTPVVRPDGSLLPTNTHSLRSFVDEAAQKALPRAQEQSLPLQMLFGGNGRGFYFSATDRDPKPDEFKHLTQGVMSIQGLPVAFTILSNGDSQAVVAAALEMLKTARRQ